MLRKLNVINVCSCFFCYSYYFKCYCGELVKYVITVSFCFEFSIVQSTLICRLDYTVLFFHSKQCCLPASF